MLAGFFLELNYTLLLGSFFFHCSTTVHVFDSSLCLHSGVLTNKLKIIVPFIKPNISVQIILLTHFEVLMRPNPSKRSQTRRVSLVFILNAISHVSLNQLTPQSLLDLCFPSHALLFTLYCKPAAYVFFCFFCFDLVVASQRTVKQHRRACVLWVVYVYVVQHVGACGVSSPTSHRYWLSFVVSFYELSSTEFSISYRKPQLLQVLSCLILWSQNHPFIIVCANA